MKKKLFLLIVLSISFCLRSFSQATGFTDELYTPGFNKGVGFVTDPTGRFFVWEQDGKIWTVKNGVKSTTPLIDLTEEIIPSAQMGLIGVVLDPDFLNNGYIYLFYSVDIHYELFYGTPDYNLNLLDGGGNYLPQPSFGRLTRYTISNLANDYPAINLSSRFILLGETRQTGVPSTAYAHIGGAMAFGQDGTLMLATGDGAANGPGLDSNGDDHGDIGSYTPWSSFQECLDLGIMTPDENIGSLRSQLDGSLNGKMLRLDPATGNGLASNPNFDVNNPRSAISRTWGKGFRNPFRLTWKPESGSHHPEDANPGIFWLADVGRDAKEEVNVISASNQNFGWPKYEGIDFEHLWASSISIPNNEYIRPIIDYRDSQGRTWHNDHIESIGGSGGVAGTNYIAGTCAIGAVFYENTDFPVQYQNSVYVADFDSRWIFQGKLDSNHQLISLENFFQVPDKITYFDVHPTMAGFFYLSGAGGVDTQLRHLKYNTGNQAPIVLLTANPTNGGNAVSVSFDASNSYDPEGSNISYIWDFGDSSTGSTVAKPTHVYNASTVQQFKAKVTVTDALGLSKSDSIYISMNNTPPVINSTSIDNLNTTPQNQAVPVTLSANVTDTEHDASQLTYRWIVALAHNGHEHVENDLIGNNISFTIPPTACESGNATYWQRIYLIVTDPLGLSTEYVKDIFPLCGGNSQTITFPQIPTKINTDTPFQLSASASSSLPISYFVLKGPANVVGNTITLTGIPGTVEVRAIQNGGSGFDPAPAKTITFNVNKSQIITDFISATLNASIVSATSVSLNWSFPIGTYQSYDIFKNGLFLATVSSSTTNYTVGGLVSNAAYKFTIVGKDASSNKTNSQSIFVTIPTISSCTPTYLSDLNWVSATNGFGPVEINQSNGFGEPNDGTTITLNGVTYAKGLGTHAQSVIIYALNGSYTRLQSDVGIDDEIGCGYLRFNVYKDNVLAFQSSIMQANSPTESIDIDITGTNMLKLEVDMLGEETCDHGDWAGIKVLSSCIINDNVPPTAPSNISLSNIVSNGFTINWQASSDNVGVTDYNIYINDVLVGTTTNTSYGYTGIVGSSKISVQAKDSIGNTSVGGVFEIRLNCSETLNLVSPTHDYPKNSNVVIYTNQTITASNTIIDLGNVKYFSGKSIILNPGFKVDSGTSFLAQIQGCN
jgi:glucose/arabinose dehydrogenase